MVQPSEPIAIIGTACRLPGGANEPSKLWKLLHEPRDVLQKIPLTRFNPNAFYNPDGTYHGSSNVTESYFLSEDHRHFDAKFFNIKAVEADSIDPQQRFVLETVYESLETAGLPLETLRGSDTAVYVGLMGMEYGDIMMRDLNSVPTYFATGTSRAIVSNRISYVFDWHGPSMTIDTACSSSLVAVHQAVNQLRSGSSRVAIAAGVNLILGPEPYIIESKLKMLSPGSRSRMWDVDADGYARGEGFASVVLKCLSNAIADGDNIECIIRESGVNQDGRTKGITVPSQSAQVALIRDTYARAGLDLTRIQDRCQFFEAHGTGTPAGDPVEAEAVAQAFFASDLGHENVEPTSNLFVGSIKTVIGHTEGTAGLAGLLKASLAIQNAIIPPNMLFNKLNPAIEPFYHNLLVPVVAQPWPETYGSDVRRASVNSFGFGGTNAHVILESYAQNTQTSPNCSGNSELYIPFTFSAASDSSLLQTLKAYSSYLTETPVTNLRDLAWTLQARRTELSVRFTISASTMEILLAKLNTRISSSKESEIPRARSSTTSPRILGVFTGQGAQWAEMGACLIRGSIAVQKDLAALERVLKDLPEADRPLWSLKEEILKDASESQLKKATLSQPLCTAIQIILVNLLKIAGVEFDAVVGHSSGEIGAAYAAGFISAEDAMKIAYYRGFHSTLAQGPNKENGAMLAVGTSLEDANEFCSLPHFEGRLSVAASNSSASVTLSGDIDAIEEAKDVFEEEGKFARILKVDKAYHSHHMHPASEPYLESLQACNITLASDRRSNCLWYSSVYGGEVVSATEDLCGSYWRDNMVKSVLFSQAVENAVSQDLKMDLVLELGPHPALQGPAQQTILDVTGKQLPYSGILSRGTNDIEAFSDALGFLWAHAGKAAVNLTTIDDHLSSRTDHTLVVGLPRYSWDHDRIYWHESRMSRAFRSRKDPIHPLLGVASDDSTRQELRWKNLLRPKELPWLQDHQLQGEIVFPAAGYVVAAIEACRTLSSDQPIKMIELLGLVIDRAISFSDDSAEVETCTSLTINMDNVKQDQVLATFKYYSDIGRGSTALSLSANAELKITYGQYLPQCLPIRGSVDEDLNPVDTDQFYSSLRGLGYTYEHDFKGLSSMRRKYNRGTGILKKAAKTQHENFLIHPAMLDSAFQAIFLAFCWPGDGRLWSLHVPVKIESLIITTAPSIEGSEEMQLIFDSTLIEDSSGAVQGDVSIFEQDGKHAVIKVEGLEVVPFANSSAADDVPMFSKTVWGPALPNVDAIGFRRAIPAENVLASIMERISYFYLKELDRDFTIEERSRAQPHHQSIFDYADYCFSLVKNNATSFLKKEWEHDTWKQITPLLEEYKDRTEIKLMRAVGDNLSAVVRGQTTPLEHMLKDNVLNDFYVDGLGMPEYTDYLARLTQQMTHRYPHMRILELGAGTGGATKKIMKLLKQQYASYTFTDISTGFFEKAEQVFAEYANKMIFKVFDLEKDATAQGFVEESYDIVIASLVLHATANLEKTMTRVRSILKPGGFLLMLEVSSNTAIRMGMTMSSMPGWWLGKDDGRALSPCVTAPQWNTVLTKTGFSGIDTITPELDTLPFPLAVIVAQAVDERIETLRCPLDSPASEIKLPSLVLVGGRTLQTLKARDSIGKLLYQRYSKLTYLDSVESVIELEQMSTVILLQDLDEPIFKSMTPATLDGLKHLVDAAKVLMWVTHGCRANEPYSNASVGFGRSMMMEYPHMRIQMFDLERAEKLNVYMLAESLLRLEYEDAWDREGLLEGRLWSIESELSYENDHLVIPRVVLDQPANDRYNSSRRNLHETVEMNLSAVTIEYAKSLFNLRKLNPIQDLDTDKMPLITLRVSYSTLSAIYLKHFGYLYIIIGICSETGVKMVALADQNASSVTVNSTWTIPCSVEKHEEIWFLQSFAAELVAQGVLAILEDEGTLLLNNPPLSLVENIQLKLKNKSSQFAYITQHQENNRMAILVHPHDSQRELKKIIPKSTSLYVDFSISSPEYQAHSQISQCLPSCCEEVPISSFLRPLSSKRSGAQKESFMTVMNDEIQKLLDYRLCNGRPETDDSTAVLRLDEFPYAPQNPFAVVNWDSCTTATLQTLPADYGRLFSSKKTYILFGLSGALGQSLCEWMVGRGARTVILSSRNPKVSQKWITEFEKRDASIHVLPCDVTDKAALTEFMQHIDEVFPPVAGIVNGAMVLEDSMFFDMSFETMQNVLQPKINGSIYLDELFSENTLDFFIMFSSLACIIGNRGQSNYTSANMFMTSLVANRRKRGLAASVIAIGAIMGLGYMAREVGQYVLDQLLNAGYINLGERDYHQMFAEAVAAGRPDSGRASELITGLRVVKQDDNDKPSWWTNSRFQHIVLQDEGKTTVKHEITAAVPMKTRLKEVKKSEAIFDIMKDSFYAKLQSVLHLEFDTTERQNAILDQGAEQLGIDSLVAVEVRSWWLKELGIDMPVLKIMGGASVREMIEFAITKLSPDLVPNLDSVKAGTSATDSSLNLKVPPPPAIAASALDNTPLAILNNHTNVPSSESSSNARSDTEATTPPGIRTSDQSPTASEISEFAPAPKMTMSVVERMSYGQAGFWFMTHFLQDKTTYNVTASFNLSGFVRIRDLERAVHDVGQLHEGLRTRFFEDEITHEAMQGIMETSKLFLERKAISTKNERDSEFDALKNYTFDLSSGETMRIILLTQSHDVHHLLIGYSHINMDGISLQILMSDLAKAYKGIKLDTNVLQYREYSAKQRQDVTNNRLSDEIAFWKKEFVEIPESLPILSVSSVSQRHPVTHYEGHVATRTVHPEMALLVKALCRKTSVTNFHLYLATFKTLLFRFSGTSDLCIGMADANRSDEKSLGSIGYYLNLLPLRFRIDQKQTFHEALKEASAKSYAALKNGKVPFNLLIEELGAPRSANHSPLFQAFIDYRPGVQGKGPFGNCQIESDKFDVGRIPYDIALDVIDNRNGDAHVSLMVQKSLYDETAAQLLLDSYFELLEQFTHDATLTLRNVSLYQKNSIEEALQLGQGPMLASQLPETCLHRIDEITLKNPAELALKDGTGSTLTYAEMNHRVSTFAKTLQQQNIGPGCAVVMLQTPTVDWVCSMLATLRIGAVFVPLDWRTPDARLTTIIRDCDAKVMLTNSATCKAAERLKSLGVNMVNVTSIETNMQVDVTILPRNDDLAFIYYTSGTTGVPKGVAISHSNLTNQIEGDLSRFKVGRRVILQQTPMTFDPCLIQVFTALMTGGTVVVATAAQRGDPLALTAMIAEEGITYTACCVSEIADWLEYGDLEALRNSKWRTAVLGGEKLTVEVRIALQALKIPQMRLINAYGPTEITSTCASAEVSLDPERLFEPIVAHACPNYGLYILDEARKPVPIGVVGELFVGGAGVAQGYINDKEKTAAAFFPNEFATKDFITRGWSTMYKTGDLARLDKDGAFHFLRRAGDDSQIKLRGFRIELEDIESTLLKTADGVLSGAVVSVRGDPQFLVAHVTFHHSSSMSPGEQSTFLARLASCLPLPTYMQPALILPLERLPLTQNNKLDRSAVSKLPLPENMSEKENDNAAVHLNHLQAELKAVWEEVLTPSVAALYKITVLSDFFAVGGNSLTLVRLRSLIKRSFGVDVSLVHLFESSTLASMAVRIEQNYKTALPAIDWDQELVLPVQQVQLPADETLLPPTTPPKIVVLTGATGFVGKAILQRLLEDDSVQTIHCIAVRNSANIPTLFTSPKVVVHRGDLTRPRLGLSSAAAKSVFSAADVIIHNAADVSFLKTYHSLRQANFHSTKELVALCLPRKVPIHYVSTAGVTYFTGENSIPEASITKFYTPPTDGSEGYVASKWASERYLELINARDGLPVVIHRPSSITGEGAPATDIVQNLVKYSRMMKVVPKTAHIKGFMDFVSVEGVANGIVNEVVEGSSLLSKGLKYKHQSGEVEVPFADLKDYLQKEMGESIGVLPLTEWTVEATNFGLSSMVAAYLGTLQDMEHLPVMPRLLHDAN